MSTAVPGRIRGEVLSVRRTGAYHHLTLRTPGIAAGTRPGHFVALAVGDDEPVRLGRRAFWVYAADPAGLYGGSTEVMVAVRGPGTAWLTGLRTGDPVDVLGPLGKPFALPREPVACLLVGGGYGAAPLLGLARRLVERGCKVHMLLGAATEDALLSPLEARRAATSVGLATADGSVGTPGPVSALVPEVFRTHGAEVAYACGPHDLLRAVAEAAAAHGAYSQCAVEVPTRCGTGLCLSCVLEVTGDDGRVRSVRACIDGPVFAGDAVRWGRL
jgi:dihydroorotate dehydrogenase electron transfer subunit